VTAGTRHSLPHSFALRDSSRQLARSVYLLLYLVMGAERMLGAPDRVLQAALGCGIGALILVRVVAARANRL